MLSGPDHLILPMLLQWPCHQPSLGTNPHGTRQVLTLPPLTPTLAPLNRAGGSVIFDYFDDKLLKRRGRMDMLEIKS